MFGFVHDFSIEMEVKSYPWIHKILVGTLSVRNDRPESSHDRFRSEKSSCKGPSSILISESAKNIRLPTAIEKLMVKETIVLQLMYTGIGQTAISGPGALVSTLFQF